MVNAEQMSILKRKRYTFAKYINKLCRMRSIIIVTKNEIRKEKRKKVPDFRKIFTRRKSIDMWIRRIEWTLKQKVGISWEDIKKIK
jgi:hypothetical protein